jgi:hypothetical protein
MAAVDADHALKRFRTSYARSSQSLAGVVYNRWNVILNGTTSHASGWQPGGALFRGHGHVSDAGLCPISCEPTI